MILLNCADFADATAYMKLLNMSQLLITKHSYLLKQLEDEAVDRNEDL